MELLSSTSYEMLIPHDNHTLFSIGGDHSLLGLIARPLASHEPKGKCLRRHLI